jgi:hypothetical protein
MEFSWNVSLLVACQAFLGVASGFGFISQLSDSNWDYQDNVSKISQRSVLVSSKEAGTNPKTVETEGLKHVSVYCGEGDSEHETGAKRGQQHASVWIGEDDTFDLDAEEISDFVEDQIDLMTYDEGSVSFFQNSAPKNLNPLLKNTNVLPREGYYISNILRFWDHGKGAENDNILNRPQGFFLEISKLNVRS